MKMKQHVVRVNMISVLEACRNHVGKFSPPTRMTHLPPPPPPAGPFKFSLQPSQPPIPKLATAMGHTNPCLDLYYHHREGSDALSTCDFYESQKQLLPLAWSHNPLTTLKLICNLLDRRGDGGNPDQEAFYSAAIWLHETHPKTLACNLLPIFGSFGVIMDVPPILSLVLRGQVPLERKKKDAWKLISSRRSRRDIRSIKEKTQEKASALLNKRKMTHLANKAAERYESDPDYQFLHNQVSGLFAECLKSDIEKLQHHLQRHNDTNKEDDENYCLEITNAARHCPATDLERESIGRKVFPRESYPEYQGVEEAHYASIVRDRLRKEVLVPLGKALASPDYHVGANRWGYNPGFKREPCPVHKYLRELKANATAYAGDALLPHEILDYVSSGSVGQVAELQWKKMVEDVYLKQGKLKNFLAVCDLDHRGGALALLVCQLSEDPWKGKVISYSENPRLHLIQGKDLKSTWKFMGQRMAEGRDSDADFRKVFDLILEVAVNRNVKPEQMVKKVLALTSCNWFSSFWGETTYEEIQSKFKDKGYTMPHLVIWNFFKPMYAPGRFARPEPGVTLLSGYSDALLRSFLENDGEIGPYHVMEAAISRPDYQTLVVVD